MFQIEEIIIEKQKIDILGPNLQDVISIPKIPTLPEIPIRTQGMW